jgi:hypothetical protein
MHKEYTLGEEVEQIEEAKFEVGHEIKVHMPGHPAHGMHGEISAISDGIASVKSKKFKSGKYTQGGNKGGTTWHGNSTRVPLRALRPATTNEEFDQIDEAKSDLTPEHKETIRAKMIKKYGGSAKNVKFKYDPYWNQHEVTHMNHSNRQGFVHYARVRDGKATLTTHPHTTINEEE